MSASERPGEPERPSGPTESVELTASASTLIEGRAPLREALQRWLDEAADARAREIWFCDPDLSLWPVGDRAWIDALSRWVGPGRRLTVLLADDGPMQRQHPRWVAWRRTWGHAVALWVVDADVAPHLQGWALTPGAGAIAILNPAIGRARWVRDPHALQLALAQLQAWRDRAQPGVPVHPLGL